MTDGTPLSNEERLQQTYYDSIASLYDEHYGNPSALRYRYWVYDIALKEVELSGKTALDAMCGGGEGTGYLQARGSKTVGLDISENCCDIYRSRYPDSQVVCSSILNTEFPDSHFDIVLTDSLHHLHPNVDKGIDEIYRILRPGGYFCCWEPSSNSLPDQLRRVWYRLDHKFFGENEQSIDIPSLERAHQDRYQVVSTTYGGNLAYLLVNCSMAFRIPTSFVQVYARPLMNMERAIARFQPKLLSLWVLCLMRKRVDAHIGTAKS